MPFLSEEHVQELLSYAASYASCAICGHLTAIDYDRTADEFYALHSPGCPRYDHKRDGHRLTIVPFVEDRTNED
jgi:hypothetical protein